MGRKLGPLPLWAWAIIAAGVGWYAWRKYKGQSATYQALIPNGIQPLGVPGGAFPATIQSVPSMSADMVNTPTANGVGSSSLQGASTFTVPRLSFTSSVGSGTGGAGGGSGGLELAGSVTGYTADQVAAAAARYAQGRSYGGVPYQPHKVQQEGTITYHGSTPGVMIKYSTPGGGADTTEWTPL
jgi:hypothetical protein